MSRQTEHGKPDTTLPQPELNPLLNPLLSEHMGRWAEVYFTAQPENREQAVLDLLQQLKRENTARTQNFTFEDSSEGSIHAKTSPSTALPETRPKWTEQTGLHSGEMPTVLCPSCGESQPTGQRFCGFCGTVIHDEGDVERGNSVVSRLRENGGPDPQPSDWVARTDHEHQDFRSYGYSGGEYASEGDFRDTVFTFGGNVPEESGGYHFRAYIGAALILLIAALAFMAYRGEREWLGKSHPLPEAVGNTSSDAQPAAKAEAPPPAPRADEKRPETAAPEKLRLEEPKSSQQEPSKAASAVPDERGSTPRATVSTPNAAGTMAARGNGSQELAEAERYLTGTHGGRNSAEAARWLWQAVAKKNATASVLLSDLYLKGDGVPKNCDQARLLLDTAARKGAAGAGERLRNLQAFGCQ